VKAARDDSIMQAKGMFGRAGEEKKSRGSALYNDKTRTLESAVRQFQTSSAGIRSSCCSSTVVPNDIVHFDRMTASSAVGSYSDLYSTSSIKKRRISYHQEVSNCAVDALRYTNYTTKKGSCHMRYRSLNQEDRVAYALRITQPGI
jgi:hypothetical protein